MATMDQQGTTEPLPSVLTVANVVYALHTLAIVVGIAGSATVVGSFIGSVPSIVAVILNYVKRGDARGTWLESHFAWQIRTFWFALVWSIFVFLVGLPLTLVIVGFGIWAVGFFILGIWAIYRIAVGWTRLNDRRPVG